MSNSVRRTPFRTVVSVLGAAVMASGVVLAGTSAPAAAAGNPYTAAGVCGSGYKVQRSHALPGARVYQLYNGTYNCVVTLKTKSIGKNTKITAGLQVKGSSWAYETGSYKYYAGPIKQRGKGKCVRYFGFHGGKNYTSPWGNCG